MAETENSHQTRETQTLALLFQGLFIEEIESERFDEIWPMFQEVCRAGETYPFPMDTEFEEAKKLWFCPGARVFLASLEGQAVATRYLVPNKVGLGSHIANTGVIIDSNYRGQGLGHKMMSFALTKAKKLGFHALQLNLVVESNTGSLAICKKFGFEIVGRLPKAFHYRGERYIDAFILYRSLLEPGTD